MPSGAIVLEYQENEKANYVHGDGGKRWHVEGDKGKWGKSTWIECDNEIQNVLNECWDTSEKLTKHKWGKHLYTFDLQAYTQTNNTTCKVRELSYFDSDPVFIMPEHDAPTPEGRSVQLPAWKKHGIGSYENMDQWEQEEPEETYECSKSCDIRITVPTAENPHAWEYCKAQCRLRIPKSKSEHEAMCNCCAHDHSDKCGPQGRGMTPSPQRDAEVEEDLIDRDAGSDEDWKWRQQDKWDGSDDEPDKRWSKDDAWRKADAAPRDEGGWEVDEETTDPDPHGPPPSRKGKGKSTSRHKPSRPRDVKRAQEFQARKGFKDADKGSSKGVFRPKHCAVAPSKSTSSSGAWQSSTGWSATSAAAAWGSGTWSQPTDGASTDMCVCETGYSLLHAFMIGVFLAFLILTVWYFYKPKSKPVPVAQPKAKAKSNSVTYRPESDAMIYFSTSAVHRTRCFHSLETCRGLNRATGVCSTHACKICVGKTIFSDFPDLQ